MALPKSYFLFMFICQLCGMALLWSQESVVAEPEEKVIQVVPKFEEQAKTEPETPVAKQPKIIEIPEKTELLFTSESAESKYSEYAGEWRALQVQDTWVIRMKSDTMQACRLDFGPFLTSYDLSISAKIIGTSKGRLKPRYGVGLYGKYGFWLRVSGGNNKLELVQYGEVLTSVPYQWSDKWNHVELRMKAEKDYWLLIGRAWLPDEQRSKEPNITYKITKDQLTHSLKGRGNLSASPYNGLPIYFDEIELRKVTQWPSYKIIEAETVVEEKVNEED